MECKLADLYTSIYCSWLSISLAVKIEVRRRRPGCVIENESVRELWFVSYWRATW